MIVGRVEDCKIRPEGKGMMRKDASDHVQAFFFVGIHVCVRA